MYDTRPHDKKQAGTVSLSSLISFILICLLVRFQTAGLRRSFLPFAVNSAGKINKNSWGNHIAATNSLWKFGIVTHEEWWIFGMKNYFILVNGEFITFNSFIRNYSCGFMVTPKQQSLFPIFHWNIKHVYGRVSFSCRCVLRQILLSVHTTSLSLIGARADPKVSNLSSLSLCASWYSALVNAMGKKYGFFSNPLGFLQTL